MDKNFFSAENNFSAAHAVEHLTKERKNPKTARRKLLILASASLFVLSLGILLFAVPALMFFLLLAACGAAALVWYLRRFVSVEYEYSISQGEMTMDAIYGAKQRKELFCFRIRDMELIAPVTEATRAKWSGRPFSKKIFAAAAPDAPDTYFAICRGEGGGKTLIFFEATEKALRVMKIYNKNVIIQ